MTGPLGSEREQEIRDHQARTDYRHFRDETAEVLAELDRCRMSLTTNHASWQQAQAEIARLRAECARYREALEQIASTGLFPVTRIAEEALAVAAGQDREAGT